VAGAVGYVLPYSPATFILGGVDMSSINFLKINVLKDEKELLKLRLQETVADGLSTYTENMSIVIEFFNSRIKELAEEK